ncbi:MAG: Hsp20/alpha crystallin family protein, partial [Nitrosarchaeum sp.]
NVKPGLLSSADTREPIVDSIVDEKEKLVKLVAEMPGVEKSDVKILVQDKTVDISAEHDKKKYHVKVPIKYKVDENSAKASYKNGILELVFKLIEDEKPKGKKVEVE